MWDLKSDAEVILANKLKMLNEEDFTPRPLGIFGENGGSATIRKMAATDKMRRTNITKSAKKSWPDA